MNNNPFEENTSPNEKEVEVETTQPESTENTTKEPEVAKETEQNTESESMAATAPVEAEPSVDNPKPKSKKNLIVILSIVGAAIVVAVLVIFLIIPAMTKTNYKDAYLNTKQLYEAVLEINDTATCQTAYNYVANYKSSSSSIMDDGGSAIPKSQFDEAFKNCQADLDLIKSLSGKIGTIKSINAFTRDTGIKPIYDQAIAAYEEVSSKATEFSNNMTTLKAYKEWLSISMIPGKATDSTISEKVKIFTDTGNETLVNYANTWKEKVTAYNNAAKELSDFGTQGDWCERSGIGVGNLSNPCYGKANNDQYNSEKSVFKKANDDAKKAYDDFIKSDFKNISEFINKDTIPSGYDLRTKINSLRNVVTEQYEKNYDEADGVCSVLWSVVVCD